MTEQFWIVRKQLWNAVQPKFQIWMNHKTCAAIFFVQMKPK